MINLELKRQYFVTLGNGSSEFEYVVNELLPESMQHDYDLSEIEEANIVRGRYVLLIKDDVVVKEIDLTCGE